MIDTDEDQLKLNELIAMKYSEVFDSWEKSFLDGIEHLEKKYTDLDKHEKAVVRRLYSWWRGRD